MKNKSTLDKKILNTLELQEITVYFEYPKKGKKLEECIENILKVKLNIK